MVVYSTYFEGIIDKTSQLREAQAHRQDVSRQVNVICGGFKANRSRKLSNTQYPQLTDKVAMRILIKGGVWKNTEDEILEGGSDEVWEESVGPDLVPPRSQVSETMQGPLV